MELNKWLSVLELFGIQTQIQVVDITVNFKLKIKSCIYKRSDKLNLYGAIHSPNPWFYSSSIAESCDQMAKGEEDTNNHSQEACHEGPKFEYIRK